MRALKALAPLSKHLLFRSPDGRQLLDPRPELLRKWVLVTSRESAQQDQLDAELVFRHSAFQSRLLLMRDEAYGLYVQYEQDGDDMLYVLVGRGSSDVTVTVYSGRNPRQLSTDQFASDLQAWAAIEYFCETGERAPQLNWRAF